MSTTTLHRTLAVVAASWLAAAALAADGQSAAGIDAETAFERLKAMAGTWHGAAAVETGEQLWTTHEIRVVVDGFAVMETMRPTSGHEMINVYHLDGEDLVLAHYCSGGHHPKMKLNRLVSGERDLVFDFAGASNFDPAVDKHIHDARIRILDDDRVESRWSAHDRGVEIYRVSFTLVRSPEG